VHPLGDASAVFGIGVAAGALGATVGGGSLLSVPFLIFLGLPPAVAIATDRFAGLGAGVAGGVRFWIGGRIVWRHVPCLAAASLVGALVGASALLRADPEVLRAAVGVLLVLLVPLLFARRDLGVVATSPTRLRLGVGLVLYLAIQVLAGFFGPGTGTLVFYVLMVCFGLTITQAVATQAIPFLLATVASLVLFAAADLVDYAHGIVLLAGTAVGGFAGAHLALAGGDRWVRRVFAVVVVAAALRLLL